MEDKSFLDIGDTLLSEVLVEYASNDVVNKIKETPSAKKSSQPFLVNMKEVNCSRELLVEYLQLAMDDFGFCVMDNFLSDEDSRKVCLECEALSLIPGLLEDAGKYGEEDNKINTFRSDLICWLNGSEKLCASINTLNFTFNILVSSLLKNRTRVTHKSHTQLSYFPAKSFGYKHHIDNPNNNGRLLTVTYFCNKDYDVTKDGGIFRCYIKNNTKYVDLEPKYNRAFIHWSDRRIMKETLPCNRNIFSLTSWYFDSLV